MTTTEPASAQPSSSQPSTTPPSEARPSLGRATALQAAGTTLSRLTGFGRVVALAYAVGQTRLSDAYNIANTTPNIIYELLLGGVLSATLVPVFVRRLRRPETATSAAVSDDDETAIGAIVTVVLLIGVAASVALALAAPYIVDLYLGTGKPEQRQVATLLLRLFAPQVACYAAITVATALLQARRRFGAPMFAPIANNAMVIATLLALPHVAKSLEIGRFRSDHVGIALLGGGTTAGVLAMTAVLIARVPGTGVRVRLRWQPRHPAVREVAGLSTWTLGYVVANQIAFLVVLRLAVRVAGASTAYTTAQQFFILPHAIYAVSVISALQPDLAEDWHDRDPGRFARRMASGLQNILAFIVPSAVGLAIIAGPLVAGLLQHGALDATAAHTTSRTLLWFAVGLPGFSAYIYLVNTFQAMQDVRTIFFLYVFENGCNIVAALALHHRFGAPGLAASYSIAYAAAAIAAALVLARRFDEPCWEGLGRHLLRVAGAAATVVPGALIGLVVGAAAIHQHTARAALQLALATSLGGLAFIIGARVLQVREPLTVVAPLLRRLPGLRRLLPGPVAR